jgi:hypothetical protein
LKLSKVNARTSLSMFALQCLHLCQPFDLDRPRNVITLTKVQHRFFGELHWYLEPVPGLKHTYVAKVAAAFDAPYPSAADPEHLVRVYANAH